MEVGVRERRQRSGKGRGDISLSYKTGVKILFLELMGRG